MTPTAVLDYVLSELPPPPADVLEVGAGDGKLAAALRVAGYEVLAVDPAALLGTGVQPTALLDVRGWFDAAVAVVSLHHIEPLAASCAHLAELLRPEGRLVVDEFDVARLDGRATAWWLARRLERGAVEERDPDAIIAGLRGHIHPVAAICSALRPFFRLGPVTRGAYLHRWELGPELSDDEERLVNAGELPATGVRFRADRREF